jgi:serine/threonine-protein kinase
MLPEKLVGQQLGSYRLEAILGSGGMAVVYRAYRDQGEPVALKVLFPPPDISAELRLRFEREARTAARLRHPAIVPILEAGQADGYAYLAMPLVEGQTLAERLVQSGPLDEAEAADIGWQLADALDYAHRQGVVHRDVKPSNVLLTGDGRALLTDFGVAQALDDPALTRTGQTVGTPAYMAPEQASGEGTIDGRADLYSLGIVLYQMITGRTPFQGATPRVLYAHLYEPPPPPSSIATVSPAMEAIILKALAKEPAGRYQTGAAMAQALAGSGEQGGTHLYLPASPRRKTIWQSRWLWLIPLIIVIGLGIWQFNGPDAATPVGLVDPGPTFTPTSSPVEPVVLAVSPTPSPAQPSPTPTVLSAATPTPSPLPSPTPTPTLPPPTPTPLPLPSPTPPPTDTPAPTATPTSCPQPGAPEFAALLADATFSQRLGCPLGEAVITSMAWQPFERGAMLWRADLNLIYILGPDGRWRSTGDTWREGDPDSDPSLAAPNGLHQPVRGFGLAWRERPGVRDMLGWGTAEEQGFQALLQEFSGGLLWHDAPNQRFFVLLNDGTYQVEAEN